MAVYRLRLTDHGKARLSERVEIPRKTLNEISGKLWAKQRVGLRPAKDLAVYIDLEDGCVAVVYPSVLGGWVVRTVLPAADAEVTDLG